MKNPDTQVATCNHYEPDYALILDAPSLNGPEYRHGQKLLFSRSAPVKTGDLCAIEFVNGQRVLAHLETVLPDYVLAELPYPENPNSEVHHCLIATVLGDESGKSLSVKAKHIASVHRCVGHYAAEVSK